jgi:hypothetical protein
MKHVLLLAAMSLATAYAAAPDGAELYKQRCGICHDAKGQARTPTRDEIGQRTPEFIYRAMFEGAMLTQSVGLTDDEGRAIARFLTGKEFGTAPISTVGKCSAAPGPLTLTDTSWNGWGNDPTNGRYQPKPGLAASDVPKLKLKWAFGFVDETISLRATDRGRGPRVYRQRQRQHLFSGRQDRMFLLGVRRRRVGAHRHQHRQGSRP